VGTLYEAATGLDPLTRYVLPLGGQVTPATEKRPRPPEPEVAWSRALPDRLVGAKVLTDGNLVLLANAGVVTVCKPDGTAVWQKTVSSGEVWSLDATSDGKLIVVGSGPTVVGLDATGQQIFMAPPAAAAPVHTVTCVAVAPDGSRVAYGLSDGSLWITNRPSEARALVPGVTAEDKKTPPQPYLEASFAGGNLTARTAREWHTIGVADGKIAQRTPVTKAQDPQKAAYQDPLRVIKEVLPRGGKAAVIYWGGLVRIGDGAGKVTAERQFPQDVSRAVWAGDGLLVVGLAEGQVVALKVP
jgi:hypothetical protein